MKDVDNKNGCGQTECSLLVVILCGPILLYVLASVMVQWVFLVRYDNSSRTHFLRGHATCGGTDKEGLQACGCVYRRKPQIS